MIKYNNNVDFNDPSNRRNFIIETLIEIDDFINTEWFSQSLSTSLKTTNNDIKFLRDYVIGSSLQIIGVPNKGIKIIGAEIDLRILLANLKFDQLMSASFIYSQSATDYLENFTLFDTDEKQNILLLIFADISNKRNHKNLDIVPNYLMTNKIESQIKIMEKMYEKETNIPNSFNEAKLRCFPLSLNVSEYDSEYLTSESEESFNQLLKGLVETVEEKFYISINKDTMKNIMRSHLIVLYNRVSFGIEIDGTSLWNIEMNKKFPLSYQVAEVMMNYIIQELNPRLESTNLKNKEWLEFEVSCLTVYCELILNNKRKQENVCLITDYPRSLSSIIENRLKILLGDKMNIDVYSFQDIKNIDFNDFIMCFSTRKLDTQLAIPLFIIFEDLEEKSKDSNKINYKEWDQIFYKQNRIKKAVFKLDENKNLYENIVDMVNQGDYDRDFVEVWSKKGNSSLYAEGIAIPHAINNISDDIILTIGYTEKHLKCSNDLQLVFLIGIPSTMNKTVKQNILALYDAILSIRKDDISDVLQTCKTISIKQKG